MGWKGVLAAPVQVVAVKKYAGKNLSELSFGKGDVITLVKTDDKGVKGFGELGSRAGWFPLACVKEAAPGAEDDGGGSKKKDKTKAVLDDFLRSPRSPAAAAAAAASAAAAAEGSVAGAATTATATVTADEGGLPLAAEPARRKRSVVVVPDLEISAGGAGAADVPPGGGETLATVADSTDGGRPSSGRLARSYADAAVGDGDAGTRPAAAAPLSLSSPGAGWSTDAQAQVRNAALLSPRLRAAAAVASDTAPGSPGSGAVPSRFAGVPPALVLCADAIAAEGCETVGVFRIPGDESSLAELRRDFAKERFQVLRGNSPFVVADLLKHYVRSMPEPLLTHALYDAWIAAANQSNEAACVDAVRSLVAELAAPNRVALEHLILLLRCVSLRADVNKMTQDNLAILFGPSLCAPRVESKEDLLRVGVKQSIVLLLLEHATDLFPRAAVMDYASHADVRAALMLSDDEERRLRKKFSRAQRALSVNLGAGGGASSVSKTRKNSSVVVPSAEPVRTRPTAPATGGSAITKSDYVQQLEAEVRRLNAELQLAREENEMLRASMRGGKSKKK